MQQILKSKYFWSKFTKNFITLFSVLILSMAFLSNPQGILTKGPDQASAQYYQNGYYDSWWNSYYYQPTNVAPVWPYYQPASTICCYSPATNAPTPPSNSQICCYAPQGPSNYNNPTTYTNYPSNYNYPVTYSNYPTYNQPSYNYPSYNDYPTYNYPTYNSTYYPSQETSVNNDINVRSNSNSDSESNSSPSQSQNQSINLSLPTYSYY